MGLRINNLVSLRAATALQKTQRAIARSLERLSSGQRVNSPRDDAGAYSLGVGLSAQIRGLAQANLGLNAALGMVETADAAISTQMEIILKMRELASRSANGIISDSDRSSLDSEFQTLLDEYNRITTDTHFNGTKLIDGSFSTTLIQAGSRKGDSIGLSIGSSQASAVFVQRSTVGTGTFALDGTVGSVAGTDGVRSVDVNADGVLDLISIGYASNAVSVSLGNGNGTFQAAMTFSAGPSPGWEICADLNADGKQDIAFTNLGDATVGILFGNGDGTFASRVTLGVGSAPLGFSTGDLNGDGRIDLFTADMADNTVSVLLGNGDGTFGARSTLETGASPMVVYAADINGDTVSDLIVADGAGASVSIFIGNGNGTFQTRITKEIGSGAYEAIAADVNGDGYQDILSVDGGDATVSILIGNGNGTFKNRTTLEVASDSFNITAVDLNGDGILDLITSDRVDDTISIMIGNGNGTFQPRSTILVGSGAYSLGNCIGVGDLNGDGVSDFVVADGWVDQLGVYIANTTQSTGTPTLSISSRARAEDILDVLDGALVSLASNRAELSGLHSRLDVAASYSLMLGANLQEARSRRLDTDYSIEIAELVKNQILETVQVAVLAQSNLNLNLVTRLLQN